MMIYLVSYTLALLLSLPLTIFGIWLGKRLGLTDAPDVRKVHREPIPCVGGVTIYLSAAMALLVLLFLDATGPLFTGAERKLGFLAAAATAAFLLGWVDDIKALRARQKLLVQLLAATLVYYGGIRIDAVALDQGEPIALGWLAWPITVLWIVGVMNAVNLSDGVDGLAASVATIACGVVAALAVWSGQPMPAVLMLVTLGALTGFLPFNLPPARIFLGDSGSLLLGFAIAASSVVCFMKSNVLWVLALPATALSIPIFDTLAAITRRFVARRPIFAPDRGHFHHRLLQLGFGHRRVVGFVGVSTLIFTALGSLTLRASARQSVFILAGVVTLLIALFGMVGVVRFGAVIAGLRRRFHLGKRTREEINEFCRLQLQFDQVKTLEAWWEALCCAAGRLDFAWISVSTVDIGGNANTYVWRCPETPLPGTRLSIIKVPVRCTSLFVSAEIETAVNTNGSVESAIRRASLLGRLMDEFGMPAQEPGAPGLDPAADRITLNKRLVPTPLPITPLPALVGDDPNPNGSAQGPHVTGKIVNATVRSIPADR